MKPNKLAKRDWVSQQLTDPGVRASFEQERAAHEFVTQIESVLNEKKITKAELARALGRSAPSITQALRKGRNLSIKLMSELAGACDHELHIRLRERDARGGPIYVEPERNWRGVVVERAADCAAARDALMRESRCAFGVPFGDDPTEGLFYPPEAGSSWAVTPLPVKYGSPKERSS